LKSRIEAPEDPRWTPEALRDIERVIETVTSGHGLDRATEDERWAHVFLAGCVRRELIVKGKVEKRKVQLHFLQGGKKEAKGREALIRVLEQSNLQSFLVHDLAVLFDERVREKAVQEFSPIDRSTYHYVNETRRLKFVYRSKKPRHNLTDSEIWMFMRPSDGKKRRVKGAMRFFGLSRQAVYQALKRMERAILAEMKERGDPRLDAYLGVSKTKPERRGEDVSGTSRKIAETINAR